MKKSAVLVGLIFMIVGCAANQVITTGSLLHYDEAVWASYRHQTIKSEAPEVVYDLEFCGTRSHVFRRTGHVGARLFGNKFEEWAEFAYCEADGSSHRLDIKIFEKVQYGYLAEDEVEPITKIINDEMTGKFGSADHPPRLYINAPILAKSGLVELVYHERGQAGVFVQEIYEGDWRVVDDKSMVDVVCDGPSGSEP